MCTPYSRGYVWTDAENELSKTVCLKPHFVRIKYTLDNYFQSISNTCCLRGFLNIFVMFYNYGGIIFITRRKDEKNNNKIKIFECVMCTHLPPHPDSKAG